MQLFKRLKHETPKFYHKVSVVNGNLEAPGLGLCPEDRQKIEDEVNIIFHSAATVRFDEKINVAVGINVLGTREMIKLAKKIKNLKVSPSFIRLIQNRRYSNVCICSPEGYAASDPIRYLFSNSSTSKCHVRSRVKSDTNENCCEVPSISFSQDCVQYQYSRMQLYDYVTSIIYSIESQKPFRYNLFVNEENNYFSRRSWIYQRVLSII